MNRTEIGVVCISVLLPLLSVTAQTAAAQTQDRTKTESSTQVRDRDIYGYQLMTPQERDEFRTKMRTAKTVAEREQS